MIVVAKIIIEAVASPPIAAIHHGLARDLRGRHGVAAGRRVHVAGGQRGRGRRARLLVVGEHVPRVLGDQRRLSSHLHLTTLHFHKTHCVVLSLRHHLTTRRRFVVVVVVVVVVLSNSSTVRVAIDLYSSLQQ